MIHFLLINKLSYIPTVCEVCQIYKSHKLPFIISSNKAKDPFMIIHIDAWSLSPLISRNGYTWYVSFIDEHTHCTWIYFLKTKKDVKD